MASTPEVFEDLNPRLKEASVKLDDLKEFLDVDAKQAQALKLEEQSAAPDFWADQARATKAMTELSRLQDDVSSYMALATKLEEANLLWLLAREESDRESYLEAMAVLDDLDRELERVEVRTLLGSEYDEADAIASLHAGEGGTESCDWAAMLLRMYLRWAERQGLEAEVLDVQPGEEAGIKQATFTLKGRFAYGLLSAERGVHRLVRISPYDASNRRHTSFASLDVIPEVEDSVDISIDPADLRVDVFRSGGPGGQSVNTTDSAIRITHLPTRTVVAVQNERSQLQNKAVAMKILASRLAERARQEKRQELEELRGEQMEIGFGSQIRSYVLHPYQMVKDHRTGVEVRNPEAVLDGDIDVFIAAELRRRRSTKSSKT
ncbi:MAG TPA: peptide chain release factor 2 [Actinomycetota bacterium]|nr:peptide chain release factor 2 [Actinomycetota bacterium]